MPISRGQMPRQMYGLGSLVKSITKGVKSAVSGVVDTVKDVAGSDLGKAALLGAGIYGLGGGTFFGRALPGLAAKGSFGIGNIAPNVMNYLVGTGGGPAGLSTKGILGSGGKFSTLGKFAAIAAPSIIGGMFTAKEQEDMEALRQSGDRGLLAGYLDRYYRNLNPRADDTTVANFVRANMAYGGRMEYDKGGPTLSYEEAKAMNPGMFSAEVETDVVRPNTELLNYIKRIKDAAEKGTIPMDFAMDLIKQKTMEQGVDLKDLRDDIMETQRIEQAYGGRIGYAFGNPEQNAIRAAGIMNLPLNQNPAGVTELDLRETGGFIPPVGVKEKADDIPAMLSNNEFVFTAKSVKEMGDGDVNKGAQRMYDMMKKLENGGRV